MRYGDEENLALRQETLYKARLDINNTAEINGDQLTFARRMLFEDKMSMVLPEQFEEMEREQARFKYPSEFRPQIILTDRSGTVNFTFSYLEQESVSNDTITDKQKDLQMASKRMRPANVFGEVKIIETGVLTIPWYSSRATAFDADVFVVQFLAAIDTKLMMGGFSCVYGEHEDWQIRLPQCLSTIRDETSDMNEEG